MQGYTDNPQILGGLPSEGPIAEALKQLLAEDSVWVPVLVPAIAVPVPYNGAELARRIKAHVNYCLKLELVAPDVLDRLNRQFDVLIAALDGNNKPAVNAAVVALLTEAFAHNPGLSHLKSDEDDEDQDTGPVTLRSIAVQSSPGTRAPVQSPALHRVAARALVFDLRYLLTRSNVGG
ncbi:MAG: hypothetical protein NVS3B2_16610 [Ramlibacter sp.]